MHSGRGLLCSAEYQEELLGILSLPQGRAPKMNPDPSVLEEGRVVHDQRQVNSLGEQM